MKKVPYRRHRNMKMRNVIVMGSSMILTVFVIGVLVVSEEITAIELSAYGILYVLICVPIMLMPFGNILEWKRNGEVVTYFQVGPFQFDRVVHEKPRPVHIEKNDKGEFCIVMDFSHEKKLVLEKFPTNEVAKERLDDFRK